MLARVISVGICGTDREEAAGGRARPPQGAADLVIGHEMIAQVQQVGASVSELAAGDLVVFTVRRGCGTCPACAADRADMCSSGGYRERGIWGLDGYQSELVVDSARNAVRVPPGLRAAGVLTEPLSVAEKAIDEAARIQNARIPVVEDRASWPRERRCLVAGLGPIGLLAAMALRLRGAQVWGLDVVDADGARPAWLKAIGGTYLDARTVAAEAVGESMGGMDLIVEATGVASLELNLLDALGRNGIYVLTGIPGGDRPLQVQGAELIRRLVLENQVMVGSVNAAREHFRAAVSDLLLAQEKWPGHVERLITTRRPYGEFLAALSRHEPGEIKVTLEWSSAGPAATALR